MAVAAEDVPGGPARPVPINDLAKIEVKMPQTYEGQHVLITGGSSGIGLALAQELARLGANLCVLARREDVLQQACQEIKSLGRSPSQWVETINADVTDYEQLSARLDEYIGRRGCPDILINSAGVVKPAEITEMDLQTLHWTMDIDYYGTVHMAKIIYPLMLKRGSGHIVNISSAAGFAGIYGYGAYSSAKFAVSGFSEVLRCEARPHGVQVHLVFPTDTQTPQLDFERQHKPPILLLLSDENNKPVQPEVVARKILKGMAANRFVITTSFEGALFHFIATRLGGLRFFYLDTLVNSAIRRLKESDRPHKTGA